MASTSRSNSGIVVHASPALAPLPASDVESIALLANLRAGGVDAAVTTDGWTDVGKPFVTNQRAPVLPSQFASLPSFRSADTSLSGAQRADAQTWAAYIDGQVTDLVYHSLYSLPPNYPYLAGAQLAALSFPMNHYVPQRLRGIHKARLQSVGLWGVGGSLAGDADAPEEERKALEESIVVAPGGTRTERKWAGWNSGREAAERSRKFGEEKIRQRAAAAFEPLARKLGEAAFFFGKRPTSLDIALFANVTLVLSPALPNALLADVLRAEFPALVAHHDAVLAALWPKGWASVRRVAASPATTAASSSFSLAGFRSYLPSWAGGAASASKKKETKAAEPGEETLEAQQRSLLYGRWLWYAGAGAAFVTYILMSGIVSIASNDEEDEEVWVEIGEDEEDDGEDEFFVSGLPVWDDDEE